MFDYACAAPYVPIDMHEGGIAKTAIAMSPHKLVGGVGAPGVLVVNKSVLINTVPNRPGGGTVFFVRPVCVSFRIPFHIAANRFVQKGIATFRTLSSAKRFVENNLEVACKSSRVWGRVEHQTSLAPFAPGWRLTCERRWTLFEFTRRTVRSVRTMQIVGACRAYRLCSRRVCHEPVA